MNPGGAARLLYVDATAGAAGDMILAALVDAGAPAPRLRRLLGTLPLERWSWRLRRVERAGIAAQRIEVHTSASSPARRLKDLRRLLAAGALPRRARERALAIFERLFEAEAKVHGTTRERTHLHEAGAADAIVDIVGTCLALEFLEPGRIVVSPLATGFGRVSCEHGEYPVPAPATAELVRGVPVLGGGHEGERLTPTGAAILTTLADAWGPLPPMEIERIGYGAGARDDAGVANVVRVCVGRALAASASEGAAACVIEFTLDDATPQVVAYAAERLLAAGALDVYTTPAQMKKGRSGHHVTVLGRPDQLGELSRAIFAETTTLGLRYRHEGRIELAREQRRVATPWGTVRVKLGRLDGELVQVWPEYEDCAALARRHGVPLKRVQQAALAAFAGGERSAARKGTKRR